MTDQFAPIEVKVDRSSLTIVGCPEELARLLQYTRLEISHKNGNFQSNPIPTSYVNYDPKTKLCRTYPNALHLVEKHAKSIHQTLTIQDSRTKPVLNLDNIDRSNYRSVCYEALQAVATARQSGIIVAPTGIGKTSILCGLVEMLPKDFKVLVTTEDRNVALQLHKALQVALPNEKIGLHCRPTSIIGRIIVTHLGALQDFTQGDMVYSGHDLKSFDCWICDEVHRLPVQSRQPYLSQFKTIYAWGLTATPSRTDNSHILNYVVFGPQLFSVNQQQVLDIQEKTGEKGIVPIQTLVYPLTTENPIDPSLSLSAKIRKVYMQNPALKALLIKALSQLHDLVDAKIMIFVDTRRLGFLISRWIPGFTFVHGLHSLEYRQSILDKFRSGKLTKIICTDIWSEGIDVPDLGYVIDCSAKVSPNRIIQRAGRAARSADNKELGTYIMLLSTTSEALFNQGIHKLRSIDELGWDIQFMFARDKVKSLEFEQAPVLTELGTFLENPPSSLN